MKLDFLGYLYFATLLLAMICSLYRYKILDKASRIFSFFVVLSAIAEFIACFFAKKYHNNIPVYTIYSLIEFGFISLYFNYSIDVFISNKIGYYIGFAGITWGIINIIFLQGLNRMNSYFLIIEGLLIICMALFSFFRLFLKYDQLLLHRYHHFWFATILVFFWSITFFNWSFYEYFIIKHKEEMWIVNSSILIVNIITYLAISFVFILYSKMTRTIE